MRQSLRLAVFLAAALWMSGGMRGIAQQQNTQSAGDAAQQAPDAPPPQPDAPQPQQKTSKKDSSKSTSSTASSAASSSDSSAPASPAPAPNQAPAQGSVNPASSAEPRSTAADNPFPEAVSQRAADGDSGTTDSSTPAPATAPASSTAKPRSTAADNPFPEDISRHAADGDAGGAGSKAEPSQPSSGSAVPGASDLGGAKNQAAKSTAKPGEITDPARAKKDTQVGDFYLSRGDLQGAYDRYKDAVTYDPTNMDGVYGLAETAMRLKKFSEAERNYQLYLEVIPNGGKAKRALKELSSLAAQK